MHIVLIHVCPLPQYIHEFSEADPSDHAVFLLASWCLEITLNTIKAEPHQCTCLTAADVKSQRPALKRQELVETLTTPLDIPTVNVIEDSVNADAKLQIPVYTLYSLIPRLLPVFQCWASLFSVCIEKMGVASG